MLCRERTMSGSSLNELRAKLSAFYAEGSSYTAFATPSSQIHCWEHVARVSRERSVHLGAARVLEVGAGRSGFPGWLNSEGRGANYVLSAQDVTRKNVDWLESQFDEVWIGDIRDIPEEKKFDVVFSTYVLEHVVNPESHLEYLYSLLDKGGRLMLFCPRYDMPGYLPPSTRHLGALKRLMLQGVSMANRLRTVVLGEPAFLVQSDLAVFHRPFFTDSDACHWVSNYDLAAWARKVGAEFEVLDLSPGNGLKDYVVKKFLTCAVMLSKR